MATWKKAIKKRENGEDVEMQLPEIVSASRSTDIPAFYADWFFHRLKKGYSAWTNPFNGVRGYVSYENTRFIIFWSKNPRPLLEHLHELKELNIGCYIQYTLNDYENERLELGVPPLDERIETFKLHYFHIASDTDAFKFSITVCIYSCTLACIHRRYEPPRAPIL